MLNSPFFLVQDFSPFGYYVLFLYLGSGSISILIQVIITPTLTLPEAVKKWVKRGFFRKIFQ